jgi:hypothetical protein
MTRVEGIVKEAREFERDAIDLLARHESAPARTFNLQRTLEELKGLSLKQEKLLEDSVKCIRMGIFRGAYVLSWAAMADYLEGWLAEDKQGNLSSKYPSWNTSSAKGLRESTSESQIITALRKCGYFAKDEEKALIDLLNRRNLCAHPTTYTPNLNMTLGFLSELHHWFSELNKMRT